ncbi:MAG: SPOR domain-containing protein [Proteobacteria bacterium]|nr:SPOR domain-containing protein [Pseudomonadota bacterium]
MQDLGKYTKRSHVAIQTKYVSFFVVGSIALVCLVFVLGVLVGSRQVDQKVCSEPDPLAMLDIKSNEPPPPASVKPVDLSFHKQLSIKQDQVPTPASLMNGSHGSRAKPLMVKTSGREAASDATQITPRLKELPIPEKIPNDEPGYYSLQVGSFQGRREANQMIRKLERAGHHVFLVSVNMPERGGMWYRVRVGPFQSKREAWRYKREFEERERLPAFVVKRRARG